MPEEREAGFMFTNIETKMISNKFLSKNVKVCDSCNLEKKNSNERII